MPTAMDRERVIIGAVSTKGGAAKTASTASLGYALAASGERVTLVDLDKSCGLTYGFGGLEVPAGESTGALLQEQVGVEDIAIDGLPGGMSLLPANREDLIAAEYALQAASVAGSFRLERVLAGLTGIVLLDSPGAANQLFVNAITAADWILVPTPPEADGIREAGFVLNQIREMASYSPTPARPLGVLLTIYEPRTRNTQVCEVLAEEVAATGGTTLFATRIPKDTLLKESRLAGGPVGALYPSSRAARAYDALAGEVLTRIQEREAS